MKKRIILTAILAVCALHGATLDQQFAKPPDSAKPYTWWHWLNGNITKEGITSDLESMKEGGLAGCYMFNCGGNMPRGDVRFMQPEWQSMFKYAVKECKRLGLKFGVHNCDGFSQSGGPWITPETSMKVLSWSAATFEGGKPVETDLEMPRTKENFYRDIAVIAFPIPQGNDLIPDQITGSVKKEQLIKLYDNNDLTIAVFPPAKKERHHIDFIFKNQQTMRSITMSNFTPHKWEGDQPLELQVSDDGKTFNSVGTFTANFDFREGGTITAAFNDTQGKIFRVCFSNPTAVRFGEMRLSSAAKIHFAESKATRLRARGHGSEAQQYRAHKGPDRNRKLPASHVIPRKQVRVLSKQMDSNGKFRWNVPAGRWRVLRIGYTSNGKYVGPATEEGYGLECDKFDPEVIRFHLDQYVGKLIELAGSETGSTFTTVEIDSWECAIQNWTAGFEQRFNRDTNYKLFSFMPTLLEGWIISDADTSERFLWDWRRFIADQISESYFDTAARYFRKKGLIYVGESNGRQQFLYDNAYSRNSAITMGEFWTDTTPGQGVRVDNKLASSVAHTTGKKIVASESYTSSPNSARWQKHPFTLKRMGDEAFCAGINQFVFHTFAHQPYDVIGPGFTFFFWGLNFNRGNTWWCEVDSWTEYLARCNMMLRKGQQVCDVLWYVGQDVPNVIEWRDTLVPPLPKEHDFDGCDTLALYGAKVMSNGEIELRSGARYKVLLLPNLDTMRPAVASKILELLKNGATVLAPKRPLQSPSLSDFGAGDKFVRTTVAEAWSCSNLHQSSSFEELFKKIKLAPDFSYKAKDPDAKIIYVHRRSDDTDIYFISNQRDTVEQIETKFRVSGKIPELWDPLTGKTVTPAAFYTENGLTALPLSMERFGSIFVIFRATAKNEPRLRIVENQETLPVVNPPLTIEDGKVIASLSAQSSLKITTHSGKTELIKDGNIPAPQEISGPWQVTFPENLGAPESVTLDKLISLSDHQQPGIKYFSGTAEYSTSFQLDATLLEERGRAKQNLNRKELYLDLGNVEVIATVELNGKELGTLWKPPFRLRIDQAALKGSNNLKVRVTNLWPNRMIGDAALPKDDIEWAKKVTAGNQLPALWPEWLKKGEPRPSGRVTFCTRCNVWRRDDPLLPSGLLGPVRIIPMERIVVD